jgi:PhzF family phenazine biosynthesis protein
VIRVRVIDAFADEPFAGNPAAVCLLDGERWPDERWMRKLAAELNLSETAFAVRHAASSATWRLRWFTTAVEDDLCGHATLATAHALHQDGCLAGRARFLTRSGTLDAEVAADGSITLGLPAAGVAEIAVPVGLANALGTEPDATFATGRLRDVVAVLRAEREVRALAPDLQALAAITRRDGIRGVAVTARAEARDGYDFVSRFFSPADGIPEDPVTGSAHTALAPYWAERLGRDALVGFQASRRGGVVRTRVDGDRVYLTGRAVTVLDATLARGASAI